MKKSLIWLSAVSVLGAVGCSDDAVAPGAGDSAAEAGPTGADAGSEDAGPRPNVDRSDPDAIVEIGEGDALTKAETPELAWNFIEIPGSLCRDGKTWGMSVNVNPDSDKLLVYMEGGGACLNFTTCIGNPTGLPDGDPSNALLVRDDTNPFKDYNFVYFPYCSGDVFTGTNPSGYNGEPMTGHTNVKLALERLVPTFGDKVDEVMLTGMSAGGFGVAWNWMTFQDAFPDVRVHAIDDSGPPMGLDFIPGCLQNHVGELWGWEDSIHPACADCNEVTGNVIRPLMELALNRTTKNRFALLSNDEDGIIKTFFAYGENDCSSVDALFATYPNGKFPMGLDELQDFSNEHDNIRMFETVGGGHTFFGGSNVWSVESDGQTIGDFISDFHSNAKGWRSSRP